jgi:hypothetical protein
VISLILYGRNDAHGYNLHRRAALSLNCLAEVLTHPDDEIVFVDYNTPDELPTFVEAIADTLTSRCLERVRVLRVRASVHHERYSSRTHLSVVEPVARNAAVRRTNPANRWLLSTNTDMVLVPPPAESLSDVCAGLPDAFYGLARFELPEWLWETLPRMRPDHSISELRHLGPRLRLDERTPSLEWIRFDAPGDFQLCLRDDLFAIDGFDEEMLLGWHVDSNLARRLALHRGSIETIERLAGYHCNHSRTPTVYHGTVVANDWDRFFFDVEHATLPSQRGSWGLVDVPVEEIATAWFGGIALASSLVTAIPPREPEHVATTDVDWAFGLTYDSGHVVPFVADSIAVSPSGGTVGYLGANPMLEQMLRVVAAELDRGLTVEAAHDRSAAAELAASADLFVLDLGLDATDRAVLDLPRTGYPIGLQRVLDAMHQLVDQERSRLERGDHPRRFVLVNSTTQYTRDYVDTHFEYSFSTMHSRVRRATVRLSPREDESIAEGRAHAARLLRWGERSNDAREPLQLRVGPALPLPALEDFRAFGAGWAAPEADGIWTSGRRADVCFRLDSTSAGPHFLSVSIGRVGAGRDEALNVDMLIDGSKVDTQRLRGGPSPFTWRVALPAKTLSAGCFDLTLEIHPPRAWDEDERELGLQVRGFGLQRDDWRRRVDDVVSRLRRPR